MSCQGFDDKVEVTTEFRALVRRFDLLEVLKSNPAFTQPYILILWALSAGKAGQRAFSGAYSGSALVEPMSGVGPSYSLPGNSGSTRAGRARPVGHSKLRRLVRAQGALRIFDSVLRMICRWRNTKALHLVKQGGALQAKSGGCTSRTSELPIGALASRENFSPHLVFKRRV
jgi:hypothetical protein